MLGDMKLAVPLLDQLFDTLPFVGGEAVHPHYLSAIQARSKDPLDVSLEDRNSDRPSTQLAKTAYPQTLGVNYVREL